MKYLDFLEAKLTLSRHSGFAVPEESIHPMLKPHQRDIVRWALLGGRRAIFAAFGLGKSFMQLECMRQIARHEGGRQLIIAPLGVRQEFKADAAKLGLSITFIRRDEEIEGPGLSSWAVFLQKPSDLGYSDEGYDLPKLHVHYHKVSTTADPVCDKRGQLQLVDNAAMSLQAASRVKRNSLSARIEKMRAILDDNPGEHCIIWHDQEAERHAIKKAVPGVFDIHGSMDLDERENRVIGFSDGEFPLFASKPILSGSGCNFQRHCRMAIFLGIGFKFNDFIQAIHRIYRFLQERECHIHIIYADAESQVLEVLQAKWQRHNEMVQKMSEIIKKYGLSAAQMQDELRRSIGVERVEVRGQHWTAVNNDCVEETRRMAENSVGLICTSIPFANHYEYTPSVNDFGHTDDNAHFWAQMDFLTPELLRILQSSSLAGGRMEPIYSLAFTFFLLTNQSDHTAHQHTIPIHAEREIAYYDREGGGPVKSIEDCRIVAARRKERAEDAIRASPKKLFADRVEVTCFEYERPKVAQRSRK